MRASVVAERLAAHGFVAADEEAAELVESAAGDEAGLEALVAHRLTGEPLAWITGRAVFCGIEVIICPGVYVPRWHTEPLALRAVRRVPAGGVAVDVCTGSGAVARLLAAHRPHARVLATDADERAVGCARANGVEAYTGDLFAPLPAGLQADVVVGVVPYVPAPDLPLLQRDTFTFETPLAYDGGTDGLDVLRRVVRDSPRFLRPGGALLLELGADQSDTLAADLHRHGFDTAAVIRDEDGAVRGIEATLRREHFGSSRRERWFTA